VTTPAVRVARPPGRPRSLAHLQALDDAIRFRVARLKAPCRSCRPAVPCDAHGRDLGLLEAYHQMASAAVADLESARIGAAPLSGP
jgi:hypothetical protein